MCTLHWDTISQSDTGMNYDYTIIGKRAWEAAFYWLLASQTGGAYFGTPVRDWLEPVYLSTLISLTRGKCREISVFEALEMKKATSAGDKAFGVVGAAVAPDRTKFSSWDCRSI